MYCAEQINIPTELGCAIRIFLELCFQNAFICVNRMPLGIQFHLSIETYPQFCKFSNDQSPENLRAAEKKINFVFFYNFVLPCPPPLSFSPVCPVGIGHWNTPHYTAFSGWQYLQQQGFCCGILRICNILQKKMQSFKLIWP